MDGVWVHPCHDKSHGSSVTERSHTDFCLSEADGQAHDRDHGADSRGDLFDSDLVTLICVTKSGDWGVTGGTVASKICNYEIQFHHWTPLGVTSAPMDGGSPFDSVFLYCEYQANEVGL